MKYLLLITAGYIVKYLWLILPDKKIKPFPFYDLQIGMQFYADYLTERLFYVIWSWIAYDLASTYIPAIAAPMKIVWILFILFALEYVLIFNQPVGYLVGGHFTKVKPESGFFIPLSFSLLMGLLLIVLCIIQVFK